MEDLLTLPGVGRKTANLVLILSFKSQRNICVDTHVHRISNRLGWVGRGHRKKPSRLCMATTDRHWWPFISLDLVTWGQNVVGPCIPAATSACFGRFVRRSAWNALRRLRRSDQEGSHEQVVASSHLGSDVSRSASSFKPPVAGTASWFLLRIWFRARTRGQRPPQCSTAPSSSPESGGYDGSPSAGHDREKVEALFMKAFRKNPREFWHWVNAGGSYLGVKPQ